MRKLKLERPGEISISDQFALSLDGVELKPGEQIEFLVGGHWILGRIFEAKDGQLFWSSDAEWFAFPVPVFVKARRPKQD